MSHCKEETLICTLQKGLEQVLQLKEVWFWQLVQGFKIWASKDLLEEDDDESKDGLTSKDGLASNERFTSKDGGFTSKEGFTIGL